MTLHTRCIVILCAAQLLQVFGIAPFTWDPELYRPKVNLYKCFHFTDHGMTVVDCYDTDLTEIPQHLSKHAEFLIATRNKIQNLHKESFKCYTYLTYLYMDDNKISYIENGTFDLLQDLEVTLLSDNKLKNIPSGVLRLPKLRKLFLDGNVLIEGSGFEGAPPNKNLDSLSLADCHLKDLPPLGMYSKLLELNVAGNDLKMILLQQLAPLCHLHILDLSRNPRLSEDKNGDACDCHLLSSWISDKNIILPGGYKLNCTSNKKDLTHCGNMTEAMATYEACISDVAVEVDALPVHECLFRNVIIILVSHILLLILTLEFLEAKGNQDIYYINV